MAQRAGRPEHPSAADVGQDDHDVITRIVDISAATGREGTAVHNNRARAARGIIAWLLVVLSATAAIAPAAADPPGQTADPATLAAELVAAEQALRNPGTAQATRVAAARRQQTTYRTLGRHSDWAAAVRTRIPAALIGVYDRNVDARRHLTALGESEVKNSLPAWRIIAPAPANELLGYYRAAEAATGVAWTYLAAINLVETGFGRIDGVSVAAAQGPMQFLPSTFAAYGNGGDIHAPRDAIMAAGRLLAANGFASDPDRAVFAYNHSDDYVRAVGDYAAVLAADPAAFTGYYLWDIYYRTTAGDVLLPIGYSATERIPVEQYLASHPR